MSGGKTCLWFYTKQKRYCRANDVDEYGFCSRHQRKGRRSIASDIRRIQRFTKRRGA